MIINIELQRIKPHPDNPRKDLGELTELADSIKTNGILQNLTVVPEDMELYQRKIASKKAYTGEYWAVIGHRRHAAAILAGLTEAPCAVTDMDRKTQLATMLIENMQRSDLTVYEQAQGFQMMLDLGETIEVISEKTGFSESTVRRRVKLLDLDAEKFQKAEIRGATLMDYAQLDKINDPGLKDKVLDTIGTNNFSYELKRAIDLEKSEAKKATMWEEIRGFATEIEDKIGKKYVTAFWDKVDYEKIEVGERNYYFIDEGYRIEIFTDRTEQDDIAEEKEALMRQKEQEHKQQLEAIASRAFELRLEFVKNLTGLKNKLPVIIEFATRTMLLNGWQNRFNSGIFFELMDLEPDEGDEFDMEMLSSPIAEKPERALLMAAYSNCGDDTRNTYHSWKGEYDPDDDLNMLYDYLERLGYELSDEEIAYKNGTHALFAENGDCDNEE